MAHWEQECGIPFGAHARMLLQATPSISFATTSGENKVGAVWNAAYTHITGISRSWGSHGHTLSVCMGGGAV